MKLVIEYDPWDEVREAQAAEVAFRTLGMPVELRKDPRLKPAPIPLPETVQFEDVASKAD